METRKRIHQQDMWRNPGELSEAMLKLLTYNSYLADELAVLHRTATDEQTKAYMQAREEDQSQGNAEVVGRIMSLDARMAYENAQNVYKATQTLASGIQSRLRVLESELKKG